MHNNNFLDTNNLRTEIAILQEDIDPKNPSIHDFKIPVIMTSDNVQSIYTPNTNILNRRNANLSNAPIEFKNVIKLKVPKEYTYFYEGDVMPAGTKFIVAFIGGNINDIKIIGRYDN